MAVAMKMEDLKSIAQKHLKRGVFVDVPEGYMKELHRFMQKNPNDLLFTVNPTPRLGYGYVSCSQTGCNGKTVKLVYDVNQKDGGFGVGIGSLSPYQVHCSNNHRRTATSPAAIRPKRSLHPVAQAGPSRPRSSVLDRLDGKVPVPISTFMKKEEPLERRYAPSIVPAKRPSEPIVLDDDDSDDDVIDLTKDDDDDSAGPRKKIKFEAPKREPLEARDVNNLALNQLGIQSASPAPASGLSPVRLQQVFNTIIGDQAAIKAEIAQLRRRAKMGGGSTALRGLAEKERALAALEDEERGIRREMARIQASRTVTSPLRRVPQDLPPWASPKKEEPNNDNAALLWPAVAGPSRAVVPALRPQLVPPPYIGPQHPQLPGGYPLPFQHGANRFGQLVQNAAQGIGNGLNAGFNAVNAIAQTAIAHIPGRDAMADAMDEVVGAAAPQFPGRVPPWLEDRSDPDDDFNRYDVDAVNKFIIAAGNADIFDENASVQKAMKKLGLEDQHQLLPGMECVLLTHQILGVNWMYELETNEKLKRSGGILADEMGLGKTVQMIALMCINLPKEGAPRGTLVVAPLALLEQWKREVIDKTNDGLWNVHIYHSSNPGKAKSKAELESYDVVLTTYGTLANELPKEIMFQGLDKRGNDDDSDPDNLARGKKQLGKLFQVRWHRAVLDEAQNIRNRGTRSSQAVTFLKARYHWCLTGTPVINSLADLFGYFRFIGISPWNDWRHYYEHVVKRQKKDPELASDRAQGILHTCLFRRKKDSMLDGKRLIELTRKDVVLTALDFSPEERQIYEFVQGKAQAVFNKYLREGTVLKNYSHILVLILRLKQLCCHPALIQEQTGMPAMMHAGDDDKEAKDEVYRAIRLMGTTWVDQLKAKLLVMMAERVKKEKQSLDAEIEDDACPVCFDTMENGVVTACSHIYCKDCVDKLFEKPMEASPEYKANERPCPSCRQPISEEKIFLRYAFEPSDKDLDNILGEPIVKNEDGDEDDVAMPSMDELFGLGLSPKRTKGKASVKKEKKRKSLAQLYDDSDDSDDSMNDFIVQDGEDEDVKDRRRIAKIKKGKQRATDSEDDNGPIKLEDSGSESEADGRHERKEQIKLEDLPKIDKFLPSTKHMMEMIKRWAKDSPSDKVIVISQFVSCLDLVVNYLEENNVSYVRYQGNMKASERDAAVYQLQRKKGGPRVMLMSLKAGGVGLNLTRANRVIALDLAWSEAVENQAYDRVHRLGQTKDVLVDRVVIQNSIEDELLKIQARKRTLADGSLGEGVKGKKNKFSVRELAALFGIHDLHARRR